MFYFKLKLNRICVMGSFLKNKNTMKVIQCNLIKHALFYRQNPKLTLSLSLEFSGILSINSSILLDSDFLFATSSSFSPILLNFSFFFSSLNIFAFLHGGLEESGPTDFCTTFWEAEFVAL